MKGDSFMIRITSGEHAGLFVSDHIQDPDWQKYVMQHNPDAILAVADDDVFFLRKDKGIEVVGWVESLQAKLKAIGFESELVLGEVGAQIRKRIAELNLPTLSNPRPLRD